MRLKLWKKTLKQIYELISEVNNTLLRKEEHKSFFC